MERVLIVKRVSNDFDGFVIKHIQLAVPSADVLDIYRYKSKIGRKFVKIIKNSKILFLQKLILKLNVKELCSYSQIILFDDYPDLQLIKYINKYCPNTRIKLWFWNVPDYSISQYGKYCEIYCFDYEFCKSHNVKYLRQFYFEEEAKKILKEPITYDAIYVGADNKLKKILETLIDDFEQCDINYNIKLVVDRNSGMLLNKNGLEYLKKPLDYCDVLKISAKSKAIIEIVLPNQMGLTWRTLEALFLKKKLITNNKEITTYDFYNRDNIFIYGIDSISDLKRFINSPYIELDESILEKYRFSTWIQYLLEDNKNEFDKKIKK